VYEITGDTLSMGFGPGNFPAELSDQEGSLVTLSRDRGPMPTGKLPSGKKPLQDSVLGELTWDDDLDWWNTNVTVAGGGVDLHIEEFDDDVEATLAAARDFLDWIREHEGDALRFVGDQLLGDYNGGWNRGEPMTLETFIAAIRLDDITLRKQTTTIYYDDGDLFLGHSILLELTEDRQFESAYIAG